MRVALVNNGTVAPDMLRALLSGSDVVEYPLESADDVRGQDFDLIVLSGSSRFPVVYNLEVLSKELALIKESTCPVLGICFGAELLAIAYGGTLRDTGYKTKGICTVRAVGSDSLFGGRDTFDVYEAHRWVIDTVPDTLEVLAVSDTGPEIIRHRTLPHYGFQFHPEKMCDETYGDELFRALLTQIGLPASMEDPA